MYIWPGRDAACSYERALEVAAFTVPLALRNIVNVQQDTKTVSEKSTEFVKDLRKVGG